MAFLLTSASVLLILYAFLSPANFQEAHELYHHLAQLSTAVPAYVSSPRHQCGVQRGEVSDFVSALSIRKVGNLNPEDLQSPQICLLPSNQNIFNACNCSESFIIFLLSAASSHSLLFLSLKSDLMCSCLKLTVCVV